MLHLVLHMDINETILIGDEAGGDTYEQCIQKILAKSAFVQCPTDNTDTFTGSSSSTSIQLQHTKTTLSQKQRRATSKVIPTHWWDGSSIKREKLPSSKHKQTSSSVSSPSSTSSTSSTLPSLTTINSLVLPVPLWTQWEWPPNHSCPYYRTKNKKLSHTFTHHDGSIYHPLYQSLYHTLHPYRWYSTFPTGAESNDTNNSEMTMTAMNNAITANNTDIDKTMLTLAQMLPSFFDTLIQLNEWCTSSSSSLSTSIAHITIVLRTFGTDLYHVMDAITQLFLEGQHPEYIQVQQQGLRSVNIPSPPHRIVHGQWIRSNENGKTTTSAASAAASSESSKPDSNYEYQLVDDDGNIIASGDDNVVEWIHTLHLQSKDHSTGSDTKITICGIQDDYEHWSKHYCVPWAGKPIWKFVPSSPTNSANLPNQNEESSEIHYHHVLFDDNMYVFCPFILLFI
jgi:hypothetical protein